MRLRFSLVILCLIVSVGVWRGISHSRSVILDPRGEGVQKELPYAKYSFANLAMRGGMPSQIEIGRTIGEYANYSSYLFTYVSEGKTISGQLNLPHLSRQMSAVVMARGYVEKEAYETGVGTRNAAAYYASRGYITLAPDFSGYGESDPEDENALGARLAKPVEILDLLASLASLPQVDTTRVYLWGHSNGGQIMLSVAEILGTGNQKLGVRGVTLWAPVSKPFPYNILYYTDEADDQGKWLRSAIAEFERGYDVYNYSIDRYLDWITIPLTIHQGSVDDAVPQQWSDELVKNLEEQGREVTYYVYPGVDHDMKPGWDKVVARDVAFFTSLE